MSVCLSPLSDCLAPAPSHTIQPHGTLFRCFFRPPTLPLSTTHLPPTSFHVRAPTSSFFPFFLFPFLFFFLHVTTDPRGHRETAFVRREKILFLAGEKPRSIVTDFSFFFFFFKVEEKTRIEPSFFSLSLPLSNILFNGRKGDERLRGSLFFPFLSPIRILDGHVTSN